MRVNWSRWVLGLITLAVIVWAALTAMRPTPTQADFAKVESGPLRVTVESDGKTRIKDIFVVSAPVSGRLLRVSVDPGDPVKAGQQIASLEPAEPNFLSNRTVVEGRAKVKAAEANRDQAKAQVAQAKADVDYAEHVYKRIKQLNKTGYYTQEKLDEADLTLKSKIAAQEAAQKTLASREYELKQAQAELLQPTTVTTHRPTPDADCIQITAPVDGRVLYIGQESETVINAGTPIVQIGDPASLEVVLEMLTEDAVKLRPGAEAMIEQWGGNTVKGKVRLVEPYAYTKTSALGIEEQRVNVIIDFDEPYDNWKAMAHAFKVVGRVVWWESGNVMKVPMGALFRQRNRWAVYVAEEGFARLRNVDIGHSTTLEAEVIAGLKEGDQVILHPSDRIRDGGRVAQRN